MGRIVRNTKKEAASKSPTKLVSKNDCKNCNKSFKSLKQHLRRNQDCQHVYSKASEEKVAESRGQIGDTAPKKECRCCKKVFVSLLQHIKKAKKCKENYGSEGKFRKMIFKIDAKQQFISYRNILNFFIFQKY